MATKKEKSPAKTAVKPPAGKKELSPAVYVGPNMAGGLPITQFSVFKGKLPPLIQERFDSDKQFAALFVPVSDLKAVKQQLSDPATGLAKAFSAVLKTRTRR